MTALGFAPTQDIPSARAVRTVTAPAAVLPVTALPGALVAYHGSRPRDHGHWICRGACPCGCGGLSLMRRQADGIHQLRHASRANVTTIAGRVNG